MKVFALIMVLIGLNETTYSQKSMEKWLGGAGDVTGISYCSKDNQIVSSNNEGSVILWDRVTGKRKWIRRFGTDTRNGSETLARVASLDLSKDERKIAVAVTLNQIKAGVLQKGDDNFIAVLDTRTGSILQTLKGGVRPLVFSSNGNLASRVEGGGGVIWDTVSGERTQTIAILGQDAYPEDFSSDGKWLALSLGEPRSGALGSASKLIIWDVANGCEFRRLSVKGRSVDSAAFTPDSSRLFALTEGPIETIIFSVDGWTLRSAIVSEYALEGLTFSKNGQLGAAFRTLGVSGKVCVFDVATLNVKLIKEIAPDPKAIAFSSNNREIAVGRRDGRIIFIRLWS